MRSGPPDNYPAKTLIGLRAMSWLGCRNPVKIEPQNGGSGESAPPVRSLPIELWPSADRAAWEAASRPGVRLKRGGSASHLRPVTQEILTKRYGYFLDFLDRSKQLYRR